MFPTVCQKLDFPAPAVAALTQAYGVLKQDPELDQCSRLFVNGEPAEVLDRLAEKYSIHRDTVMAVSLVNAVPYLLALYRQEGIDEQLCWDTLVDLRCKLIENYDVAGVWGASATTWYQRLFSLKILKLGRLEYEPFGYKWDTPYGNVVKDTPVLNIHIPSCGSLPIAQVMDSLKRAYQFFSKDGKPVCFVCASWMLYPPMCDAVFPEGGNLHNFYKCFDIVGHYPTADNHHFWRIFGVQYAPGILDRAPSDTSLRRQLLDWMKAGNDMGIGRGAFLFDGEKIIHVLR